MEMMVLEGSCPRLGLNKGLEFGDVVVLSFVGGSGVYFRGGIIMILA